MPLDLQPVPGVAHPTTKPSALMEMLRSHMGLDVAMRTGCTFFDRAEEKLANVD